MQTGRRTKRVATWRNTLILAGMAILMNAQDAACNDEYAGQFNYGQAEGKGEDWVQAIKVLKPGYRDFISGMITVTFTAPGMTAAEARCWHQPDQANPGAWGYDAIVMKSKLIDGEKEISFPFPADEFPNGPTNIRIVTQNDATGKRDLCELQLYNKGGVKWAGIGLPDAAPPGAEGMKLIFADDFNTMPAITPSGIGARYSAHKPYDGTQDFSGWRFSHKDDFPGAHDPYEQHGTWLRIKARKWGGRNEEQGTGIIGSAHYDHGGLQAMPPCYMECRFTAQSFPGAWPAFWTLAVTDKGADELDIIEGYGGFGPGHPNSTVYHMVTHFWGQQDETGHPMKGFSRRVPTMDLGGKSYWSTTAHTYGVYIGTKETVYYFDNMEMLRHPSGPISAVTPAFFMVNYAVGGISGWPIDAKRYGNGADMWVDYIRVYGTTAPPPSISPVDGFYFSEPAKVVLQSDVKDAAIHFTTDGSEPTTKSSRYTQPLAINEACAIKAFVVADGLKPSAVAAAKVRKAMDAVEPGPTQPGLACTYYEGTWEKLPDFSALQPVKSMAVETFGMAKGVRADHFALLFKGFIKIPADGLYTFSTKSDDGSQLLINGQMIVDNDGLHGAVEKPGAAGLKQGTHAIEVRYFEAWGGESLEVRWKGPGFDRTNIPAQSLSQAAK